MTFGSILIGLALAVIVGLALARPFMTPPSVNRPPSKRRRLLVEKEEIMEQLSALDFDFDTGKIPKEMYQPQREQMLQKAEAVFKELDALKPNRRVTAVSSGAPVVRDVDAEIEAAVVRQRQQSRTAVVKPTAVTQPAARQKGNFCSQCGAPADAEDKFCANCGHRLLASQLT